MPSESWCRHDTEPAEGTRALVYCSHCGHVLEPDEHLYRQLLQYAFKQFGKADGSLAVDEVTIGDILDDLFYGSHPRTPGNP